MYIDSSSYDRHVDVLIVKMYEDVKIPEYKTEGSVGADVRAYISEGTLRINAGETTVIPTKLKMKIPPGWECQVRPRSGTALRGIQVANSPGTIDSDYRGEIGILVYNSNDYPVFIEDQERIAQLVFKKAPRATFHVVDSLDKTERGDGAYNSTGRF